MLWRRKHPKSDRLDEVLFHWLPNEPFTVRNLLDGGVSILGRVGSGKTSSSGRLLGLSIIAHPDSCGLICAAKPEDVGMWRQMFNEVGRRKDLIEFDADGGKERFNFLAEAIRHGGHAREVTRCLMTIAETLRSGGSKSRGENGEFWAREEERMIYNAVEVLRLARREVTSTDLQAFITTAAFEKKQLVDPTWRSGFHYRMINAAYLSPKSAIEEHDYQLATDYWCREICQMDERTRGNVLTGVLGLLHVFNSGLVRELISTTTTVSPDHMLEGRKWVLVNVPPARFGDAGAVINAGWKYLTQKRVLKREARDDDPFHVIWCDEAQQFVNGFDSHYIAQCRSHLGCVVFLTQSLHSYYSAMKGERGMSEAKALLANFGHRVVHSLGDYDSAEIFSQLCGRRIETFLSGSMSPTRGVFEELFGQSRFSGGFSTHYESTLQPDVFMNGLRTGGSRNGYLCDAVVVKSGEPFRCGQNFLRVAFSQR